MAKTGDEVISRVVKELWYSSLLTYQQWLLNLLFIQDLRRKIYPLGITRRIG